MEATYTVVFLPVHLVVKGEEVKVPPAAGRRDDSTGTVGGGNVRLPVFFYFQNKGRRLERNP